MTLLHDVNNTETGPWRQNAFLKVPMPRHAILTFDVMKLGQGNSCWQQSQWQCLFALEKRKLCKEIRMSRYCFIFPRNSHWRNSLTQVCLFFAVDFFVDRLHKTSTLLSSLKKGCRMKGNLTWRYYNLRNQFNSLKHWQVTGRRSIVHDRTKGVIYLRVSKLEGVNIFWVPVFLYGGLNFAIVCMIWAGIWISLKV